MAYVHFDNNPTMHQKAQRLNQKEAEAAKQFDWEILTLHQLYDPVFETCTNLYDEDGFFDDGLWRLFRNQRPVYKPLVVEFLASFTFTPLARTNPRFNTHKTIKFRLNGVWSQISLFDFGLLLGLTEDDNESKMKFKRHLELAHFEAPEGYVRQDLWDYIAMEELNPRNYRESNLRTPLLRIIHRYFSWTIFYIHTSNKINDDQLRGFYYLFNRDNRWHLPYVVETMFNEGKDDRLTHLPGGQFVTEIAINLGILDENVRRENGPPIKFENKGFDGEMTPRS